MLGQWEQALMIVNEMLDGEGNELIWLPAQVHCLRQLGRKDEADKALATFRAFLKILA